MKRSGQWPTCTDNEANRMLIYIKISLIKKQLILYACKLIIKNEHSLLSTILVCYYKIGHWHTEEKKPVGKI